MPVLQGRADAGQLPSLLKEVQRDFGRKRIWLSEYGYQTDAFGVSTSLQAQYVSQAALRAKSARYVDVLIHFIVKDEPRLAGWQSGLLTQFGALKPSFFAYMLPIAQQARKGNRTTIWGQVRPGSGRRLYKLRRLVGKSWASVGGYQLTNSRGTYLRVVNARKGTQFRVYWPADKHTSRVIVIR